MRPVKPVLTETGLEWIVARARLATLVVLLVALAGWLMQQVRALRLPGVVLMILAGASSSWLAWLALHERRVNVATLDYTAPVVPAVVEPVVTAPAVVVTVAPVVAAPVVAPVVLSPVVWKVSQVTPCGSAIQLFSDFA